MGINPKIFKAYDIRGKYPEELNEDAVFEIAEAVGKYFGRGAKIVVGHDARLSSPSLYKSALRALKDKKLRIKVIPAGLMTTPTLYFLVNELRASGGVMVTASHNPKEFNGLKVVKKGARPVSGLEVAQIVSLRNRAVRSPQRQTVPKLPHDKQAVPNPALLNLYTDFLKKFFKPRRKLKVVFDCSNGTTGIILSELFRKLKGEKLKVEAIFINDQPDGNFPAHGPNPLAAGADSQLKAEVKKRKADLGIIFDADGDRVFFADNRGRSVETHETGYVLMKMFRPPYVAGIVSSWRVKKQPKILISRVGHYFFKKMMREKNASLGVEHSGHYYFKKFFYCDSGILAAAEVINFVSGLKKNFADWLDYLPKLYRSGEINFEVSDKKRTIKKIERVYKDTAKKISKMDGLTMEFNPPAGGWWFNVRPSNTENLLRLNAEATDKKILKKELKNLEDLIS